MSKARRVWGGVVWLLAWGIVPAATAGETIGVERVWIRAGGEPSRGHLEADPVEREILAGTWERPSAPGTWEEVAADSGGWISDPRLRSGYALGVIDVPETGIYSLEALGYGAVYVNGEPRIGNTYGYTQEWQPWQPAFDFSELPVRLEAGENELLFFGSRAARLKATLRPAAGSSLRLNPRDVTCPDLVVGKSGAHWAAIPVANYTQDWIEAELVVSLEARLPRDVQQQVYLAPLPPLSVRKVPFQFFAPALRSPGSVVLEVSALVGGAIVDRVEVPVEVRGPEAVRRETFLSDVDRSVQHYGLRPAITDSSHAPPALVLSLHGAGVEATNQANSYAPRPWAHVVAPTNRRPYGFNWEGWGRLDALETLDAASRRLRHDPMRVYLTGHSMGGHGTWHVGSLHPDRFAAIGPSAGWISFWSYRPSRDPETQTAAEAMVQRATLPSRTLEMATNLDDLGVYVLHGAEDDNVPPTEAHLMLDRLAGFHENYRYHEEPGVGHWWDHSEAPGADCVNWPPMFDYFARHRRPAKEEVAHLSFRTPSPGVSAWHHWAGVIQQTRSFLPSDVTLHLDPDQRRVAGTTNNVNVLAIDLTRLGAGEVTWELDGVEGAASRPADGVLWLARRGDAFVATGSPSPDEKGPHRAGGFREAWRHGVQLVYGTRGTPEENAWAFAKARYDAEFLWYQGNSGVEFLPDTAYVAAAAPDRNVILYGNADTHARWAELWPASDCRVARGELVLGGGREEWRRRGDDLAVLAVRPRPGSDRASVGIVAGTGAAGFAVTTRRPYLSPGFAFPDVTVFRAPPAGEGSAALLVAAGFFGSDWSVASGEFAWTD